MLSRFQLLLYLHLLTGSQTASLLVYSLSCLLLVLFLVLLSLCSSSLNPNLRSDITTSFWAPRKHQRLCRLDPVSFLLLIMYVLILPLPCCIKVWQCNCSPELLSVSSIITWRSCLTRELVSFRSYQCILKRLSKFLQSCVLSGWVSLVRTWHCGSTACHLIFPIRDIQFYSPHIIRDYDRSVFVEWEWNLCFLVLSLPLYYWLCYWLLLTYAT